MPELSLAVTTYTYNDLLATIITAFLYSTSSLAQRHIPKLELIWLPVHLELVMAPLS